MAVSSVAVAEVLPWLLVALPAGTLVDRRSPRRVVLAAHTGRNWPAGTGRAAGQGTSLATVFVAVGALVTIVAITLARPLVRTGGR